MNHIRLFLILLTISACSIFSPEDNDISEADQALADELLFGKLAGGGNVRVFVESDDLKFEIQAPVRH